MRIWNSYENKNEQALQLAEYLFKTYPDNPYFHRYYARMLIHADFIQILNVNRRQSLRASIVASLVTRLPVEGMQHFSWGKWEKREDSRNSPKNTI